MGAGRRNWAILANIGEGAGRKGGVRKFIRTQQWDEDESENVESNACQEVKS
jgi:hypothetical protein